MLSFFATMFLSVKRRLFNHLNLQMPENKSETL